MSAVARRLASLVCGALFGIGLAISGMLDPARVRGFLDIFGAWDPSLMFVLAGATTISFIGIQISAHMRRPLLADAFDLPTRTRIDWRLVTGAALFGIGWGLSGLCPGPAVASLSLGLWPIAAFVGAMLIGMMLFNLTLGRSETSSSRARP